MIPPEFAGIIRSDGKGAVRLPFDTEPLAVRASCPSLSRRRTLHTLTLDPAEQLKQVRSSLEREFGATFPPSKLDTVAREALSRYATARITAFVPLLATREARAVLRTRGPVT
jgi:hypothetical protein